MKKLFYLILTFALLVIINPLKAQTYGFEMKLDNFEQVSEFEFQFEAYLRKVSGSDPIAVDVFQFQVQYNPAILNGGIFDNAELVFDNSGSGLVGSVNDGFFTSIGGNRLQYASGDAGNTGSQVTVLTDSWLKIGLFSVKLTKDGNYLNFGSAHPIFGFRADPAVTYTNLTRCNFTGTFPNYFKNGTSIFPVTNRTLTPEHGVAMDLRQIAGFWYYGDGDWDVVSNWNQVLKTENPAYVQTLPGANSNAILNGNVTVPDGYDVSLLPNGGGNGGELTVLSGVAPPLYQLTVAHLFGINGSANISGGVYNGQTVGFFTAGESVSVYAQFAFPLTIGFTSNPAGVVFTPPNGLQSVTSSFTMPANNVTVTAGFAKSSSIVPGEETSMNLGSKSLYASLTIVPGASVTVDQLFNDNSNGAEAILIKSDANGTGYLIHNNANVPATVERFLSQGKYHYVSSPIEAAPYSLFQVWPAPPSPAFADFYEWVETTRLWINLNYNLPVGVLAPGKGYAVAYSDADYTKEFVGELNVGTVPFSATYTPNEVTPFWNQRGFNFVGNPYPAALDGDAFLNAHPDVFGLYFWDEAADYQGDRDDYATYSLAGGVGVAPGVGGANTNAPTGIIAPSQGFILQVKSTPFNQNAVIPIAFENSMRVTDDSYFYKDQEDRDRIWLSVTGPQGDYNEILVAFMEGAEVEMDRTDAEKFKVTTRLAFYSQLEDGDFVIQGLPVLNQTDTYEIALGVDAGFAGNYTFDVQMIENFDPAAVITLEDRLANKFTNLRTTSQYVAQIAEPGEIRNRFFLHFNGATSVPVIDQKLTKVYALQNQIIIQHLGNSEILDVEVINTLGQLVVRTPVNATETVVTVPGHNVVYIVKVRTTEGIESHKLLIR